jgi:uncharacterized membrane protein YcjF (UPF0283 family)
LVQRWRYALKSALVAFVVVLIANIVVWWDWITGWWTQGWGNLFTVTAALLAVGVGAWTNLRNFRLAREDGRNDRLREEVAALLSATGRWNAQQEMMRKRAYDAKESFDPVSKNHRSC